MDAEQRKQAIAGVFGRAAVAYDSVGVDYFATFGRELVRRLGVTAGEDVVDVGAGRGAATFPAAETGARVLAGDLAAEMVERLDADAAARGLANVEARVLDAESPGLPAGSADVVLCSFVIFLLPDPAAALRAYRELLRPGGRLGVTIFAGHDDAWHGVNQVFDAAAPPHLRRDEDDADPGPVGTPERLAGSLRDAGFTGVESEVVRHEFRFASADQWWAWVWSHGRRAWLEPLGPDELERVRAAAYAELARFAEPDGRLPLRQDVCYTVAHVP